MDHASGWYLTGNIDGLDVTGKNKVELRLASEAEAKTMRSNDSEARGHLAALIYSNWSKAAGEPRHGNEAIEANE